MHHLIVIASGIILLIFATGNTCAQTTSQCPAPTCDCEGRPTWDAFAGALVGVAVATLLIGFTCLQFAVARNQASDEEQAKENGRPSLIKARERGLGPAVTLPPLSTTAQDAERGTQHADGDALVLKNNAASHQAKPQGKFGPPSPGQQRTSPNLRRVAQTSASAGSGSATPVLRITSALPADSDGSRPNSAVGTPGSNRPGRVGFSKARKSDRKAYLSSSELHFASTPSPGASPASVRRYPSHDTAGSSQDVPSTSHVVVSNPSAHGHNRGFDVSLSLTYDDTHPLSQAVSPPTAPSTTLADPSLEVADASQPNDELTQNHDPASEDLENCMMQGDEDQDVEDDPDVVLPEATSPETVGDETLGPLPGHETPPHYQESASPSPHSQSPQSSGEPEDSALMLSLSPQRPSQLDLDTEG